MTKYSAILVIFTMMMGHLGASQANAQHKVIVIPVGGAAKGNATQSHVLTGKSFSNQNSTGLTGTRPAAPVPKITSGSSLSGVPWPTPRFSGGLLGGYIDHLTGLKWAMPHGTEVNWLSGVNHCSGFSTPLYSNWRMSTLRELHSLIDYSQENPALPAGHPFGTVHSNPYWTSTPEIYSTTFPSNAWTVRMLTGKVEVTPMSQESAYVWCVRGGINE